MSPDSSNEKCSALFETYSAEADNARTAGAGEPGWRRRLICMGRNVVERKFFGRGILTSLPLKAPGALQQLL